MEEVRLGSSYATVLDLHPKFEKKFQIFLFVELFCEM